MKSIQEKQPTRFVEYPEIAALLWEITERQKKDIAKEVSKDLAKSFAESAKAASIHFQAYVDTLR